MTYQLTGLPACPDGCCEIADDPELIESADTFVRPMFEVLDISESTGDAARWPVPYEHHDLDGVLFR